VTDAIGFLFLVPPFRLLVAGKVWAWISANMDVRVMHPGAEQGAPNQPQSRHTGFDNVIDGEAVEVDEGEGEGPRSKPSDDSPWTRINHKDG